MTSIGSATYAPLKITGLANGFNPEAIISSLMSIERLPVERMELEQLREGDEENALRSLQSSLQSLAMNASELGSPTLFNTSQSVTSSEPSRISASIGSGAAIGGYEVEVTQLASAAQRSFTFVSPTAAEAVKIDGHEIQVSAGESVAELAKSINANSEATVYASVLGETLVLSDRATGQKASFIEVAPGGPLTEVVGSAREGKNAAYSVDGVSGSSASNTLTEAIPGVTLTLDAITTAGPVTINVAPPSMNVKKVTAQIESFITQYNSTLSKLNTELSTKPAAGLRAEVESGAGMLFGDFELEGLISSMRESVYTPVTGLPSGMSSLASIGISTGAPSGTGSFSQSAVEGKLTLEASTLEEALKTNPEGVAKMLKQWTLGFQKQVEGYGGPVGSLHTRIQSDESKAKYIGTQITSLTERLQLRQHSLEAEYSALEVAMKKYSSQSTWLTGQIAALPSKSSESSSL